ncbi:MAG TPA: hypothetical protein VGU46_07910 [Acidobacteriaceae bacterium]|nr:hypothetical protein [Acidobacteriaceae bacterium]
MSKMSGHARHVVTSNRQVEAPVLLPNDALILVILARNPSQSKDHVCKLLDMLSEEGKLIAQALLGLADEASLPITVVETAKSLRKWAQLTPSVKIRATKGRRISLNASESTEVIGSDVQNAMEMKPSFA